MAKETILAERIVQSLNRGTQLPLENKQVRKKI